MNISNIICREQYGGSLFVEQNFIELVPKTNSFIIIIIIVIIINMILITITKLKGETLNGSSARKHIKKILCRHHEGCADDVRKEIGKVNEPTMIDFNKRYKFNSADPKFIKQVTKPGLIDMITKWLISQKTHSTNPTCWHHEKCTY